VNLDPVRVVIVMQPLFAAVFAGGVGFMLGVVARQWWTDRAWRRVLP